MLFLVHLFIHVTMAVIRKVERAVVTLSPVCKVTGLQEEDMGS